MSCDDDAVGGAPTTHVERFLAELPVRLADVVDDVGLLAATAVTDVPGVSRRVEAAPGAGAPVPVERVVLRLAEPLDARLLCGWWHLRRPIAVSGDVHQDRWFVCETGIPLPDPHGPRVAAVPPTSGRWTLVARLACRPEGPLPQLSAGASPAYDLLATGGEIAEVAVVGW